MDKLKTVIITGASRGIGRETAILFARKGYNVMMNYNKSEEAAKDVCKILNKEGFNIDTYKADVSKRSQVNEMIGYCINRFGGVDVLVNNAGISKVSLFSDITQDEWDEIINVNLKGVFNCCQAVIKHMVNKKRGSIINVSSIWGMVGASCEVHYSAAKAGVIGLTKALAKELGPSNIKVNCVAPGIIETEMNSWLKDEEAITLKENTPLMRFGNVSEVANCIYFLASEESSFITGQTISPNGGFVV